MADQIVYFEKEGEVNTAQAVEIALKAAKDLGIRYLVLATTTGKTARLFKGQKHLRVIAVSHAWGFKTKGENSLKPETRAELETEGIVVFSGTHVLSGAEKGLSGVFKGVYPLQIIASALKFFGSGTKVAIEVATAALDAGLIPAGEPVIALGGTHGGADTVLVLIPSYSTTILETRVHRILAKPISPSI
jgi:hypothetical protein